MAVFHHPVDFNLPERFNINYTGKDGKAQGDYDTPRAYGFAGAFFGVLIEHYKGAFRYGLRQAGDDFNYYRAL